LSSQTSGHQAPGFQASGYQAPAKGFRTFVIIWITQSFSVIGTSLMLFVMNIWLTTKVYPGYDQKSLLAGALSAISIAYAVPALVLAPLAGAWVDRHDRRKTMIVMDAVSACLGLLLLLLLRKNLLEVWSLCLILAGYSSAATFHGAAFDTSYAMLVSEKQLPRANGMMQSIWALSGILSPALAAMLISLPTLAGNGSITGAVGRFLVGIGDGTILTVGINVLTFTIAAITPLFLTIPSPNRSDLVNVAGKKKKSIWKDILEGANFIWRRPPLLWLLITFLMVNLTSAPYGVLQPMLVKFNLAADWSARGLSYEAALAFLGSVSGIGGVIGGVLMSTWGGLKKKRVLAILIPMVLDGVAQMVFGITTRFSVAIAMAFALSLWLPIMNAHSQSIWQSQTPHELQGRVFAVRRLIAQCMGPVGTAIAGWAGGVLEPGVVLAVMGFLTAAVCLGQLLFNPAIMQVEDKEYLDQLAAVRRAVES